jgi:hypothetical protein
LNNTAIAASSGPIIILKDGSSVELWFNQSDCQMGIGSPVSFYRCGAGLFDVNGMKKPNIVGKDIFEFHILKDRVLPYGVQGDFSWNVGNCNTSGKGLSCAAEYLYN